MKKLTYMMIPAALTMTSAHAEFSADSIYQKVRPILTEYGELMLRQADYEARPFDFFRDVRRESLGTNTFASFKADDNVPFILASDENNPENTSSYLLEPGLRESLYPNDLPAQASLEEATIATPLTNGTFQKLEAINDIASGTSVVDDANTTLNNGAPHDSQTAVSEFLANQYQTKNRILIN